jgi:hypothetical protein
MSSEVAVRAPRRPAQQRGRGDMAASGYVKVQLGDETVPLPMEAQLIDFTASVAAAFSLEPGTVSTAAAHTCCFMHRLPPHFSTFHISTGELTRRVRGVRGQFECRHCDRYDALTEGLYDQLESACKIIVKVIESGSPSSKRKRRQGTAWRDLAAQHPSFEFKIKGCQELNIHDGSFVALLESALPCDRDPLRSYPVAAPNEDRDPSKFFWMPFTEPGKVEQLGDITWSQTIEINTSIPDTRYDRPFYLELSAPRWQKMHKCFEWRGPKANMRAEWSDPHDPSGPNRYVAKDNDHLAKVEDPRWLEQQTSRYTSFFERAYAGELVFLCSPECTWPRSESYRLAIRVIVSQRGFFMIEGFVIEPIWLTDWAKEEYNKLIRGVPAKPGLGPDRGVPAKLGLVFDLDETLVFVLSESRCKNMHWYKTLVGNPATQKGKKEAEDARRHRIDQAKRLGSYKVLGRPYAGLEVATRPGVSDMLSELTKKYQLNVLCNGSKSYAREVIKACGWCNYFHDGDRSRIRIVSSFWTRRMFGGPHDSSGRKDFRNIFSFYRYRECQGVVAALDDNEHIWTSTVSSAADPTRRKERQTMCIIQNTPFHGNSSGTTMASMKSIFDRTHGTFFANLKENNKQRRRINANVVNATAPVKSVLLREITRQIIMAAPSPPAGTGVRRLNLQPALAGGASNGFTIGGASPEASPGGFSNPPTPIGAQSPNWSSPAATSQMVRNAGDLQTIRGAWLVAHDVMKESDNVRSLEETLKPHQTTVDTYTAIVRGEFPSDNQPKPLLFLAAIYGRSKCLSWLLKDTTLDNAVNVRIMGEQRGRSGCTPLHYAVWYDHEACAALLLRHGADPAAKNLHGETSLKIAESKCKSLVGKFQQYTGSGSPMS